MGGWGVGWWAGPGGACMDESVSPVQAMGGSPIPVPPAYSLRSPRAPYREPSISLLVLYNMEDSLWGWGARGCEGGYQGV